MPARGGNRQSGGKAVENVGIALVEGNSKVARFDQREEKIFGLLVG